MTEDKSETKYEGGDWKKNGLALLFENNFW